MTTTATMTTPTTTFLKMVFDRWYASIKNGDSLLAALPDETLEKEVAPGKNRGLWILGHLVAVHDEMLKLLDMGEKLYPELHQPFLDSPDKSVTNLPTVAELRTYWSRQNEYMKQK